MPENVLSWYPGSLTGKFWLCPTGSWGWPQTVTLTASWLSSYTCDSCLSHVLAMCVHMRGHVIKKRHLQRNKLLFYTWVTLRGAINKGVICTYGEERQESVQRLYFTSTPHDLNRKESRSKPFQVLQAWFCSRNASCGVVGDVSFCLR